MAPKEAKLAPKDAKLVIPKDPKLAPKDTKLAAQDGKSEAGAAAAAVPGAKKDGKAEPGSVEDRINLHQLMELKAAFDRADTDGGGSLDMEEFLEAFGGVLGKNLTHEQLTHLFMKIDANSDGSVDWDEFTNYMLLETQAASNMSDRSYQVCYQDALDKNLGSVWVDPSPKALHHRNMIAGILAIPKQEKFVTHSRDGTVRVWHAGTLAHLRTLRVSESWVTDCKHFPLSNRLVASSIDRTVSFYDAGTYELTAQLTGLDTSPMCIGYWQDQEAESERMILGDDAGNIALYDIAGAADGERAPNGDVMDVPLCAQRLYRDRRHADWVTQCSFYPELNFMVSSSLDGTLKIGDLERRSRHCRQLGEVERHSGKKGVYGFQWSSLFKVLASCGLERTVSIWNPYGTRGGKPLAQLVGHTSSVQHVALNEESCQLISCDLGKTIKVWDMRNYKCLQTIQDKASYRPEDRISALMYDPVRSQLISASTSLRPWPMVKVAKRSVEGGHEQPLCAALFNVNFNEVVSGDESAQVCVWDAETGEMVFHFADLHSSKMTAMAFDEAGRRLITGGNDGTVRVWNFSNGQLLKELRNEGSSEVSSIRFIVEGQSKLIVAGGWNRKVVVWRDDEESSSLIGSDRCMSGHQEDILSIAYSSEGGGNLLATSGYDGRVLVWNMDSGVVKFTLTIAGVAAMEVDQRAIYKLVFLDRRAQALCGAGADGVLRFWNVKEGECVWEQHARHKEGEAVVALATDAANRLLFSGDSAGFMKVWDITSFVNVGGLEQSANVRELHHWRAHTKAVSSLDFIERKQLLLSASLDAKVKLWRVSPEGGRLMGVLGQVQPHGWLDRPVSGLELVRQEPPAERSRRSSASLPPSLAAETLTGAEAGAGADAGASASASASASAADAGAGAATDGANGTNGAATKALAPAAASEQGPGAMQKEVLAARTARRKTAFAQEIELLGAEVVGGKGKGTPSGSDSDGSSSDSDGDGSDSQRGGARSGTHNTQDLIRQILTKRSDPTQRKVPPLPTMHRLKIHDMMPVASPRERFTPRESARGTG